MAEAEGCAMSKRTLPVRVQTVIIKKTLAKSSRQAASIARTHGAKTTKVDETGQSYRFRQHPPENYLPNSFRAFVLNKHVTLVYGTPRGREKALKKIAGILDAWPRLSGKKHANPPRLSEAEIFEASEDGEPIMISRTRAKRLILSHKRPQWVGQVDEYGDNWLHFVDEVGEKDEYDMAKVLAWLGY